MSYALSHKEKLTHSYSLNKYILIKLNKNKIQTEFESFYHNIMKHIEHLRQNDQLKSKIRRTCENYYRIEIPYWYEEITKKFFNNKEKLILIEDKGRGGLVSHCTSFTEKCCNILLHKIFKYYLTETLES